jgi:hypothetical protein
MTQENLPKSTPHENDVRCMTMVVGSGQIFLLRVGRDFHGEDVNAAGFVEPL